MDGCMDGWMGTLLGFCTQETNWVAFCSFRGASSDDNQHLASNYNEEFSLLRRRNIYTKVIVMTLTVNTE